MRVEVYFNLHRRMYSVRALEGEDKGRVIDHLPECAIRNAKFVVSEAGRQRVLRDGRKNVHAYVRGELVAETRGYISFIGSLARKDGPIRVVTYNPYRFDSFFDLDTKEPVYEAEVCLLFQMPVSAPAILTL